MSEHREPVPSMIYNAAVGGHVTNSQQIIDENENKEQSQINAEVKQNLGQGGSVDSRIAAAVNTEKTRAEGVEATLDGRIDTLEDAVGTSGSVDSRISAAVATETTRAQTAEADRYTKSETYTKEEVHNLITTPSQEYVSVIATDQTTAVTDVLPATGAADTTYRVGNWDGTQYNDSVFSEYAWNGSAYIKLSTKSQIGEVYDISANHADTKYADLAAALGINGANIPQSLRKGGISVKFVQSSDNKYVQYRLMAQNFTTDTTQWQGVDDEPTAGSENLVKSGGIPNKKYIFGGNINISLESIISAKISNSENNELIAVPTNTTAKIAFFPILKGHHYTITILKPYTWQYAYGYCDEILVTDPTENTNLGGIINGDSYITSSGTITIEVYSELDGYYFVGFDGTSSNPTVIDNIIGTDNVCAELQTSQDVIKDEIIVNNRIPLSLSYRDGIILQGEKILANANMRTYYVSAKIGDKFSIVSFSNSNIYIGFTELQPEVKIGITNYSYGNDFSFYGQEIISHINGCFCISIAKSAVSPSVYKINNKIGKDVYKNSHKIDALGNSLQKPILRTIQAQVIDGFATPLNAVIGNPIELSTNSNRKTLKLDIENLNGSISAVVYGVSNANNCICIVNHDDVIIGYVDVNYKSWYTETYIDLNAYEDAKYMYITSGSDYNSVIHINNSLLNPKSFSDIGSIVLHFDGTETDVNGTLYSRRKQIVDSYGWKASFCIVLGFLNDAGTDWKNNAIKDEYWSLIKDGWTPMLYPVASATSKTEEQWNAWIDDTLAKFANVGVYNITTFACGNLAINDALLNACIKHNFKIIRGGGVGSDNTYVYQPDNYNCIQIQGNKKNYVLAAKMIGGDHSTITPTDLDAIHGAMQMRGARAIFSHVALEELPSGDTVNISEAYLIKVLDYIKSLENQGKIQVMNMDDLYNNLNPSDSITWNNNRTIKMFNP